MSRRFRRRLSSGWSSSEEAAMAHYHFDHEWHQERERLASLEQFEDPGTIRHLEALGFGPGWRCLEVGAGGGSIAA
jgi:hypothetical protein